MLSKLPACSISRHTHADLFFSGLLFHVTYNIFKSWSQLLSYSHNRNLTSVNFFFTDTKLASTRRDSKKRSSHACVTFVDNSNSPSGTFQVRAHLFHYIITHCPHCLSSHWPIPYRRGSTPVSTVLRKSVSFFTINIFNNKITIIELSKLKSGK